MNLSLTKFNTACAALGLMTLAACGGGGGAGSGTTSGTSISGVAATGAAFGDASVTITDANGTATSCGSTNTTTGAYTCTLPSSAVAPFVLRALSTETGIALFSVLPEKKDSTANITPLTNAIAAALSPTGDPSALASEIQANTATVTPTSVNNQVSLLQSGLQNVLTAASVTTFDPIGGSLTAGSGTGMDKVLDTVKVAIAPQSDTGAGTQAGTVTIALRADPDTTITLTNGSNTTPTAIDTTNASATLNQNPTDLISELLGKMNTCYALPVGSRVDNQTNAATASNIVHADCQAIFYLANPSNFKSGGNVVAAQGAFKGLFKAGATGTAFDKGNLEYVIKNPGAPNDGIWVVSYRAKAADGTVSYDTFALKLDNNKLRQYGNQYDYDTGVRPFVQDREFVNQLASNYLSTGYVLNITNKVDGSGNSIFTKVVVTSPGNRVFTLKPTSGMSYLGLVNSVPTTLGTNFVRIGYAPTDSNATAWTSSANVSGSEASRLFFAPTKWSDADIAAIPNQGSWKFEIYLASNPSSIATTQWARTIARAPTIAELRKLKFAALTSTQRTEILTNTASTHWYVMDGTGIADISDSNGNNAWTVPDGALAPTKATIYGNAPYTNSTWGNSFNDFTTFLGTTRKASISCSRQSNSDAHCAAGVSVGSTGNYASGTRITELQLNASSPLLDASKHIAFYLP